MDQSPQPSLSTIQRWMQAVIMHPVGVEEGIASPAARECISVEPSEAEKVIARSKALTSVERLAIYGRAYYARLLECMREEFPVLKHALGDETFDAFAAGYLQQYPSQSYTLIELGTRFPRFLDETRPAANEGDEFANSWPDFLIDLATLEQTFNEVFDGPGTEREPPLDPQRLQSIPSEEWPDVCLDPAPCLRLLPLRFPVHHYFTGVRRKENPDFPGRAETYLAVSRHGYVVRHYELSPPAYQILKSLLAGATVGEAIGQAVETAGDGTERLLSHLQEWFRDWAAEGFFRAARTKPPTDDRGVAMGRAKKPAKAVSMTVSWETVRGIALKLPKVEEGKSYGTPAFRVGKQLFARLHQDGDCVVVRIDLNERETRMAADPVAFFITDHYREYPWLLVRFSAVRKSDLRDLIHDAWRIAAPASLVDPFDTHQSQ